MLRPQTKCPTPAWALQVRVKSKLEPSCRRTELALLKLNMWPSRSRVRLEKRSLGKVDGLSAPMLDRPSTAQRKDTRSPTGPGQGRPPSSRDQRSWFAG